MILVDSSAWIEYYRKKGNEEYQKVVKRAIADDAVATIGLIQTEILSHASTIGEYESLRSDFSAYHWISVSSGEYFTISKNGFDLRRRGITVPATDLIIASVAAIHKCVLLHYDSHFELVKSVLQFESITFI